MSRFDITYLARHPGSDTPTWIGVEVSASTIKSVLVQRLRSEVVTLSSEESATMSSTPHHVLVRIAQLANEFSEDRHDVAGLGVALPGEVDRHTGTTGPLSELPGQWAGLRVRDMLTGLTGLPTVVVTREDAIQEVSATLGPSAAATGAALLASTMAERPTDGDG